MQVVHLLRPLAEDSDGILVKSSNDEKAANGRNVGLQRSTVCIEHGLDLLRDTLEFFQPRQLGRHRTNIGRRSSKGGLKLVVLKLIRLELTLTELVRLELATTELVVELIGASVRHAAVDKSSPRKRHLKRQKNIDYFRSQVLVSNLSTSFPLLNSAASLELWFTCG